MKYLVCNWKMNPKTIAAATLLFQSIRKVANNVSGITTVVCPPACFLGLLQHDESDTQYLLGAQDGHYLPDGSVTGGVSIEMLHRLGAKYLLVGHSDLHDSGDTEILNKKITSAIGLSVTPIVCIGERKRDGAGAWKKEIIQNMKKIFNKVKIPADQQLLIAYEPVWAIGARARRAASMAEFVEARDIIRNNILKLGISKKNIPVLYGGSVDHVNVHNLFSETDGFLVGRRSLDPRNLHDIIKAVENPFV